VTERLAASRRAKTIRFARRQGLILVLLGLIVAFSITSPYFLDSRNLLNIGGIAGVLGLMAITQTFLVISGGIDISVGSAVAVTGVILGALIVGGVPLWIAVALVILIGLAIGSLNGFISVRLHVDPLVTTLGTYSIFLGLAFVIAGGTQVITLDDPLFKFIGTGRVGPVPFTLLLFLSVWLVGLFIERRTTFGRAVYAVGGNMEAARLSGIRTDLVRFSLFIASGLAAAVVGVILVSQLATASPNVAGSYLLSVVTAVILGGASLAGGRGSLIGTLIAVAILGVLQNGFALLEFSAFMQNLVLGILLICAVLLDQGLRRLED
jgi:ribose transport system permease protein